MLRAQVPQRPLTGYEVRRVRDRLGDAILQLSETFRPPVPVEVIAMALPRVLVNSRSSPEPTLLTDTARRPKESVGDRPVARRMVAETGRPGH